MTIKICAIVAMAEDRVIGVNNEMPWHYPEDMQRFATLTTKHAVLMGRKTFDSLPENYKPLPRRKNIVLTRKPGFLRHTKRIDIISNLDQFIEDCKSGTYPLPSDLLWVIGGEQIYRITLPYWDELYLTHIHSKYEGDAFFPEFEKNFNLESTEDKGEYSFLHYTRS